MKRSRFTEEQIIGVLREHEAGVKTADVCRKHGISSATFFKWEVEVWRAGSLRRAPAEGPGRREPQAEEAAGRSNARQRHVKDLNAKKW